MKKELNLVEWLDSNELMSQFIKKDLEELKLDNKTILTITTGEELEDKLGDEVPGYNVEITEYNSDSDNILVIKGYSPVRMKDVKLYYYECTDIDDQKKEICRQLREYNYREELEKVERVTLNTDGEFWHVDDAYIRYAYDEYGIKNYATIDAPTFGRKEHRIYNEDGEKEFKVVENESVEQVVRDGEKEYRIIDGYIGPSDNGYYIGSEYKEIKRVVFGDISDEEKKKIIDDLDEDRKELIIETLKMAPQLDWITLPEDEEWIEDEEFEELQEPSVHDVIQEHMQKLRESAKLYTLEQFLKDSIPQAPGEKRPKIMCKDGTEYSIQAGSGIEENIEQLDEFFDIYELGESLHIEEVKDLIDGHGGLNKKIMKQRVKEQKDVYKPRDAVYEQWIEENSNGDKYIENLLRYATRQHELTQKNRQAKNLLNEYEQQEKKDGQTQSDED